MSITLLDLMKLGYFGSWATFHRENWHTRACSHDLKLVFQLTEHWFFTLKCFIYNNTYCLTNYTLEGAKEMRIV